MQRLTVIFFSCRRLDLLYRSVSAFVEINKYPISEFIIVNDSGDEAIHRQLKDTFVNVTFVLNDKNYGLIKSIDIGYSHIKTEWFFHCEDDWCVTRPGFIERSMEIMRDPKIEEVWPQDYNGQPLDPEILKAGDVSYKLVCENHQKGMNGYNDFAWHGFSTACGLKRMSDYRRVGPYENIPWQGTIWHREQAIGERYHDLGYRSACLLEDYAVNIGYGRSEYLTGNEI
jgi:GT2 family glycosyltransferase